MWANRINRRALLAACLLSGKAAAAVAGDRCRDDLAIDAETALLFSAEAPLTPAPGLRDARAVWARVPRKASQTVLFYLHGHNGYVTVDRSGHSRVPDWATSDMARRAAASREAAPLAYGLPRLGKGNRKPVVLAPEVSTPSTGSFWAREPAGQYADPSRLGAVAADCFAHLASLHRPGGDPYLSERFRQACFPAAPRPGLKRVYLSGHSGAGLPLEEVARSALLLPETGVPADLWLFDCTYWSQVAGFVKFCERWHTAGRFGGKQDAARFVCVYRPNTQTEAVADALRGEIAGILGVPPPSLVRDHTPDNFEREVRPALRGTGALFLRTHLPHDEIPTFFLPALLETAAC